MNACKRSIARSIICQDVDFSCRLQPTLWHLHLKQLRCRRSGRNGYATAAGATELCLSQDRISQTRFSESSESRSYNRNVEAIRDLEYPMLKGKTYLDHGGATIYAKSLIEDFSKAMLAGLYGNPHSDSAPAALSGKMVDDTRARALRFFGANPDDYDLIFVANATAAIKLVMESFRDLAATADGSSNFRYAYHKDSHTSIVGVRELTNNHWCFRSDEEVESWLSRDEDSDRRFTRDEEDKPCLFAYPGQSNMTGRRLPLDWTKRLRESPLPRHRNAYSLLDVAALAMNSSLKHIFANAETAPDFTVLSFYKIFGFPDLGALIVRRSSGHVLTWRKYFGGGTVDMVNVMDKAWHRLKDYTLHDGLEDGTLPFHSILALNSAMDVHERLYGSMQNISRHTQFLAKRMYDGLRQLHHGNGRPLVEIHNDPGNHFDNSAKQGATIAFNLKDSNGAFIPFQDVEQKADERGIYLRSGGLCNPGGVATYMRLRPWEFKRNWSSGYRCGSNDSPKLIAGKPAGVVRASLGAMSSISDVDSLVKFLAEVYCQKKFTRNVEGAVSLSNSSSTGSEYRRQKLPMRAVITKTELSQSTERNKDLDDRLRDVEISGMERRIAASAAA